MKNPTPFIEIDRENAFLLYAAFTGDLERTAAALGVRPKDVLLVATEENWNEKLKGILDLNKSGKPGDIERAINRALNFVQAHRLRMIIERVIKRLTNMTPEELEEYLFTSTNKAGDEISKLSTRALADLASALEKCHSLSYQALNDSMQERAKRNDGDGGVSVGDMSVRIAEAMSKAAASDTPHAQMFDAKLAIAQAEVGEPVPEPQPSIYDRE
jgi:hypothetical protein